MSWAIENPIPSPAVPDLEVDVGSCSRLGFGIDGRWPCAAPSHAGLLPGTCSSPRARYEPAERAEAPTVPCCGFREPSVLDPGENPMFPDEVVLPAGPALDSASFAHPSKLR